MWKFISLMLICCTANAEMYSCVDDSGKKVFRSEPCEKNEKQQPVVKKVEPSYYIVNSTGQKQGIVSYQPKQAPKSVAQSAARQVSAPSQPKGLKQSNWDKANEFAARQAAKAGGSSQVYRTSLALALRGLNGETTPSDYPAPTLNQAPAFSISEIPTIPQLQPSAITSCDSGGCWDDVGGRYDKGAGNTYFGPNGACQDIGGMMQCP